MSEANTNADEQQTFVNADIESDSDSKQALDEEDRLQQDLNQQVAEENKYNELRDELLRDGFEIADDDEFVECGVAFTPLTGYTIPFDRPSIVEVIFDEELQRFVIDTSPEVMSSVAVDCDDRNK